MLKSVRLDRARRLLLSVARRGLVARTITIGKGKNQGKQMKVWVRSTPKPLKRGMTVYDAGINPKQIRFHSGHIYKTATTAAGDELSFGIYNGAVSMSVNNSVSSSGARAKDKRKVVSGLDKLSNAAFSELPDNTIVYCTPYDDNSYKQQSKKNIYTTVGFSDIGGDDLYGVVKSGIVLKIDNAFADKIKDRFLDDRGFFPNRVHENGSNYDNFGYDIDGYNSDGYDEYGYDIDGYNSDGYDEYGYDRYGYDIDGYNSDGYDEYGYDSDGYDIHGYDEDGYDSDGYDIHGYNEYGYDSDGYDKDGYDSDGYDILGYDKDGYSKEPDSTH